MISIITPTYNRSYLITNLLNSLINQTTHDFEWIIIDDGSTDNTKDIVKKAINIANFKITYRYKNNNGKHSAINAGLKHCNYNWIFIVDSDDTLTHNAIEIANKEIKKISEDIVGICFRRSFKDGSPIGIDLINEKIFLTPNKAGYYYKGDLAYIFRKDIMEKNPFPIFEGEKFVPELVIWNKISDMGRILYFSGISIYFAEYMPDGYTANFKDNIKRNPKGFSFHYLDAIRRDNNFKQKIKALIRLIQCKLYMIFK